MLRRVLVCLFTFLSFSMVFFPSPSLRKTFALISFREKRKKLYSKQSVIDMLLSCNRADLDGVIKADCEFRGGRLCFLESIFIQFALSRIELLKALRFKSIELSSRAIRGSKTSYNPKGGKKKAKLMGNKILFSADDVENGSRTERERTHIKLILATTVWMGGMKTFLRWNYCRGASRWRFVYRRDSARVLRCDAMMMASFTSLLSFFLCEQKISSSSVSSSNKLGNNLMRGRRKSKRNSNAKLNLSLRSDEICEQGRGKKRETDRRHNAQSNPDWCEPFNVIDLSDNE